TFYSTIYLDEGLISKNPRSKSGTCYLPVAAISNLDGIAYKALFTETEINNAITRGNKNVADFEGVSFEPYDSEVVVLNVINVLDQVTLLEMFKIWILRKLGVTTIESIRRILNVQEKNKDS